MSSQMTRKRPGIAQFVAAVLATLVAAIAFAPQAGADTPPNHLKSFNDNGSMSFPGDTVVDSKGNIFLLNIPNDNVQKFTKEGVFVKKWGTSGSGNGQLDFPTDVAIGKNGAIYVTDSGNDRVMKFNADYSYASKWGTTGSGNGQFDNGIFGIATDPVGNVFVSDLAADRIQKFSHNGTFLGKWGSKGTTAGKFDNPDGMATDGEGNLYVADPNNDRVQKFTNNGQFIYQFGTAGNGPDQLSHPTGVSLFEDRVYVSDDFHHRVQIFTSESDLPLKNPDPKKQPEPQDGDPVPAPGEAEFDGKNLHIRLKCPLRFRPSCHSSAMPMTKKHGGRPMATKAAKRKLGPGHWTVVRFVIKPKFRAKVDQMTDRDVKLLNVTQTIRSKKVRSKKANGPSKVFHIYRVRSAGK